MKTLLTTFFTISFMVFASCETESGYLYDDWDANADAEIDEEEFVTGSDEIGYYEGWDVNNDAVLDEEEWETGWGNYYPNYDYEVEGLFSDWDLDDDGTIDNDEFDSGNFSLWDNDNSGFIDETEYDENYYDI